MAKPDGVDERPTIYDVARVAGVSKSLVSLVLQGSDLVSAKRRKAVLEAIQQLDYRPSRAAATLAGSRSHTIGVVIDDYSNLWFIQLLRGLREVLAPLGYYVTVSDQHPVGPMQMDAIDGFLAAQADGIVVAAELAQDRDALGVATVVAGTREFSIKGAVRIAGDEDVGVGLAVEHLRSLGHRRIGHITGVGGAAKRRLRAYRALMAEAGEPARDAGHEQETNEPGGYAGMVDLLQRHPEMTALFAANDTMALGALAALRETGRRVPEDFSIVGYDNSPLASAHYLDLTTIDDKSFDVGVAVAKALLQRMENPEAELDKVSIIPSLVLRSSTAGLRS